MADSLGACRLEQAVEGRHCAGCGVEFAEYVCTQCRLYAAPGAPHGPVFRSLVGHNRRGLARCGLVPACGAGPRGAGT